MPQILQEPFYKSPRSSGGHRLRDENAAAASASIAAMAFPDSNYLPNAHTPQHSQHNRRYTSQHADKEKLFNEGIAYIQANVKNFVAQQEAVTALRNALHNGGGILTVGDVKSLVHNTLELAKNKTEAAAEWLKDHGADVHRDKNGDYHYDDTNGYGYGSYKSGSDIWGYANHNIFTKGYNEGYKSWSGIFGQGSFENTKYKSKDVFDGLYHGKQKFKSPAKQDLFAAVYIAAQQDEAKITLKDGTKKALNVEQVAQLINGITDAQAAQIMKDPEKWRETLGPATKEMLKTMNNDPDAVNKAISGIDKEIGAATDLLKHLPTPAENTNAAPPKQPAANNISEAKGAGNSVQDPKPKLLAPHPP